MSVAVVAEPRTRSRGLWLASVGLAAVTAGGCAGSDGNDLAHPLATSKSATTTASLTWTCPRPDRHLSEASPCSRQSARCSAALGSDAQRAKLSRPSLRTPESSDWRIAAYSTYSKIRRFKQHQAVHRPTPTVTPSGSAVAWPLPPVCGDSAWAAPGRGVRPPGTGVDAPAGQAQVRGSRPAAARAATRPPRCTRRSPAGAGPWPGPARCRCAGVPPRGCPSG